MNIFSDSHWAILPETLTAITAQLREMSVSEIHAAQSAAPKQRMSYQNIGDGLAVVNVSGILMKSPGFFDSLFGAISSIDIAAAVRAAVADPSVQTILLAIDSPGGTVSGTGALADAIYQARQQKKIVSFISDKGASAAYWVAAQSQKVYANSTAIIGAIGTYSVLVDQSGLADKLGVKVHVVKAGQFKGLGEPGTAVTPEQLAEIQRTVDALQSEFTSGVARGRGWPVARAAALADGRVHIGASAMKAGLIDVVDNFQSVLTKLKSKPSPSPAPAARPAIAAKATPTDPKKYARAFSTLVREEMQNSRCDRQFAISVVARRQPELHKLFLQATGGPGAVELETDKYGR